MGYGLVGLAIAWVVCGVLAYGLDFAYFQRKYSPIADECYKKDRRNAVIVGFGGPIALLMTLACGGIEYGFKFR